MRKDPEVVKQRAQFPTASQMMAAKMKIRACLLEYSPQSILFRNNL